MAGLSFDASINDVNFTTRITAMERRILGLTSTATNETNKLDAQFSRLSQLAVGYFSFNALSQLPAQLLQVRGEFEQLEIAFSTLLRSKSAANQLLADVTKFAGATPFSVKETATGAKQLLAYGVAANELIPTLSRLGDISAGLGLPLERLTYLYGTTKTQGRLFAQDLNQFVGSGIPLIQELAKQFGVAEDHVKKLVEDGRVGFPQVKQAIESLTSGSGLFAGTLDAQSKSILALKERLTDAYDQVLNQIGKDNQDIISGILTTATDAVQNYQQFIDVLKIVVATYGTYKAAVLLANVADTARVFLLQSVALEQSLAAASGTVLTTAQARQIVVTKLLQQAQLSLNATLLANPFVLVATAIAGLATAYFVFRDEAVKIKSAQDLLRDANRNVSTELRSQQSEVKTLIGVIQNQNVAESERLNAYKRLNEVAPSILNNLDFEKAKTANLTQAVNEYIAVLEKKIRIESGQSALKAALDQETEAINKRKEAEKALLEQSKKPGETLTLGGSPAAATGSINLIAKRKQELDKTVQLENNARKAREGVEKEIGIIIGGKRDAQSIQAEIASTEQVLKTVDKLSLSYKQKEENLIKLRKELADINKPQTVTKKSATVDSIDADIKALKDQQKQVSTNRTEYAKYQKQIDALENKKRGITGQQTSAEKKAAKDADKIGPFGSISYYENVSKKAQEIIDKTPQTNIGEIQRQNAIKADADRKADEIRKLSAVKTFQEELDEKKKLYALYTQFVEVYGQQSADAQFGQLKASGQSYVDFLNNEIAKLEADKENVGLTDKQAENLGTLVTERDTTTQKKAGIDVFRESLDRAQESAGSLTEYIKRLQAEQAKLSPNAGIDVEKKIEVSTRIVDSERELQQQLQAFLGSVTGGEEQRLSVTRKYTDLRAAVEKKYNGNRSLDYEKAQEEISRAEKKEFDDIQKQVAETSDAFKKLNGTIDAEGRKALKIRIQYLQDYLDELARTVGIESEEYRKIAKELKDVELSLSQDTLGSIQTFVNLAGDLGDQLSEANGFLGETGKLLQGAAGSANLLLTALDESKSSTDRIAAGVSGLVNLIGIVVNSAKERKQAEKEYYAAVIASQQQYNLAINEQIGLQSELNENVFVKDYAGRFQDSFKKYNDANLNYQKALTKLEEGRAKTGQKNALDAGNIGKAIGSGAALGAAVGSIVPVIGTAIGAGVGAIVGGIVGLFAGKKKKDVFGDLLAEYPELIQKSKDGVDELNVSLAETLIANNQVDDATKALLQSTIDWEKQVQEAKKAVKELVGELAGNLGDSLRDNLVNAFKDGTDSAQAFGDSVSKILEDLVSQLLFSQIFGQAFDQLEKDLTASFDTAGGGDGSVVDDFGKFFGQAEELTKIYNQGLEDFQDEAKKYGLDVLKPTTSASKTESPNSLQGAIKGVTEETAGLLAGQINAIRISQAESGQIIKLQLIQLSEIAVNTRYNRFLESIDTGIKKLIVNDSLRGRGNPG